MDILINDQPVRYELEGERSLKDIIRGLTEWAADNNSVIGSVFIDERPIDLEDACVSDRPIGSIANVKVRLSGKADLALETLHSIEEYIAHTAAAHLDGRDPVAHHEAALESLDLILEGFHTVLGILGIKPRLVRGDASVTLSHQLSLLTGYAQRLRERYLTVGDCREIRDLLTSLTSLLPALACWVQVKSGGPGDPSCALRAVGDVLRAAREEEGTFERIGESIQLGRDNDAFRDFTRIIETLEEMTGLVNLLPRPAGGNGSPVKSVFTDITEVLRDIEKAYRDGDMVSLGDIIEYELRPRYTAAVELFDNGG